MTSNNLLNKLWDYKIFLDEIFKELQNDDIDVSNYQLDHICYRVSTNENYSILKKNFINESTLLAENIIWWREISTFKLHSPIKYKGREISVIEIPSPKLWSDYQDGFEHVEFVINKSFDDFMAMYPNVNFSKKAITKEINPEIKIWYKNWSVKFHHNSLEYVIENFE